MAFTVRNISCVLACVAALSACYVLSLDTHAQEAKPAAAAADPFQLPAGNNADDLKKFLENLMNAVPVDATQEVFKAYLDKTRAALAELLKRDIPESLYLTAAQAQLEILYMRSVIGVEQARADYDAALADLRKVAKPAVQKMARDVHIGLRSAYLTRHTPAEQKGLIDELQTLLTETKDENRDELSFLVSSLMDTTQTLERINSALALDSYERMGKNMQARGDEKLKRFATLVEPRVRRLKLPGQVVELTSTTLDGKPFDLKQLRGKVVIVDFWATWCIPCIEDFPHLLALREAYKDKGLEIVGISLDDDRETLQKFMTEKKLPWLMLFDDKGGKGFDSPLPVQYGIFSTPTTWLIDRDGKMVELAAHGKILDQQLEKLLGPMPQSTAPAAPQDPLSVPPVPK